MKKILALLLVLAMALSLVACGGKTEAPAANAGAAAPAETAAEYKVAMVTDYGDITDQSFNQTTWEACIKFGEDNGIAYKYYKPTTNDTAGRVASVELAIAEGYNVIVMPGYAFGGTIAEVSANYHRRLPDRRSCSGQCLYAAGLHRIPLRSLLLQTHLYPPFPTP